MLNAEAEKTSRVVILDEDHYATNGISYHIMSYYIGTCLSSCYKMDCFA